MESLTVYNWLCLFGFPTLVIAVAKWIRAYIKKDTEDSLAMKLGLQALLRSQMIGDYNKWMDRGYAPIYARENFENCWQQYHSLGVNGVMDSLRDKFMELPVQPPEKGASA